MVDTTGTTHVPPAAFRYTVPRQRPDLRTTFQLAAEVVPADMPPADTFIAAVRVALAWLRSKFPQLLPAADDLVSFDLDDLGLQHVLAVSIPDRGVWSARLVHPDEPFQDRPAVAGRTWTTDLALRRSEAGVRFAVRVLCASAPYVQEPIVLSRPRIVRELARSLGLREIRPLDGLPWMLQTEQDLRDLYALLTNPCRTMPVVLLTQPKANGYPGTLAPYLLDHQALASDTLGYAHVACMPTELGYSWTQQIGRTWSAFLGTVRTYQPGLSLDTDSPYAHPLTLADRILFWEHEGQEGEPAFAAFLLKQLQRQAATKTLHLGGCVFAADARVLQATLERERIAQSIREQADQTAVTTLRVQLDALQTVHQGEVTALRDQLQEVAEARDVALQLAEETEAALDQLRRERHNLVAQNTALRGALEAAKEGTSADAAIPIPTTLQDLAEWVEEHLPGRLFLHPRAIQGSKKSQYEDAELIYRALLLLAHKYRNTRLGLPGAETAWEEARTALGLQVSRSISPGRAGEQGDAYFVTYPLGTNRRTFVEYHIGRGTTKDTRRCLRIYYFWDAEAEQVVVAWLPSHLDTRAT